MNKKIIFTILALILLFSYNSYAQTVDEVINSHVDAIGGYENLKAIKTMEINGDMKMGGMEFPFIVYMKRQEKVLIESTIQGKTMKRAYDGDVAWMINPFAGTGDPEKLDEGQTKFMISMADFDGELVDYEDKGSTVELIGKEDFEGTEVYNIKLVDKYGDTFNYYIDAENYLILKETSKRKLGEKEIETETITSDFKDVNGIMMPFMIEVETDANPMGTQTILLDKVNQNVTIDDNIFVMPKDDEKDDGDYNDDDDNDNDDDNNDDNDG
jgi:hypothetical protein